MLLCPYFVLLWVFCWATVKFIGIKEKSLLNLLPTEFKLGGVGSLFQLKVLLVSGDVFTRLSLTFFRFPGWAWQGGRHRLQRGWRPTWTWSQFHVTHTWTHLSCGPTAAQPQSRLLNMLHITCCVFPVLLSHSSSRGQKDQEELKDLLETEAHWAQRLVWEADVL